MSALDAIKDEYEGLAGWVPTADQTDRNRCRMVGSREAGAGQQPFVIEVMDCAVQGRGMFAVAAEDEAAGDALQEPGEVLGACHRLAGGREVA